MASNARGICAGRGDWTAGSKITWTATGSAVTTAQRGESAWRLAYRAAAAAVAGGVVPSASLTIDTAGRIVWTAGASVAVTFAGGTHTALGFSSTSLSAAGTHTAAAAAPASFVPFERDGMIFALENAPTVGDARSLRLHSTGVWPVSAARQWRRPIVELQYYAAEVQDWLAAVAAVAELGSAHVSVLSEQGGLADVVVERWSSSTSAGGAEVTTVKLEAARYV